MPKSKYNGLQSALDRRGFLATGAALGAALLDRSPARGSQPLPGASRREPVKKRRILFNWDGGSLNFGEYPMSAKQFVEFTFGPLANSQVDAVLWCSGDGNSADYDSEVVEKHGEGVNFRFPSEPEWRTTANVRHLIQEGHDPLKLVTQAARERGIDAFVSLRLNDIHDYQASLNALPKIKREHPEWMLGDALRTYKTALNFALYEVRDFKLHMIEEYFRRYDFDGIELDFLRTALFFKPPYQYIHRHLLTDFLRTIRQRLDQRARERGRRIEVAARVDENLQACLMNGFDVPVWVREGLIDILILGSGAIDIDVPGFQKITQGTPVRIYPCVYGWGLGYPSLPAEVIRGIAANFWRQDPDGVYTFNWFPHRDFLTPLLKEIGAPETLEGKDKRYHAALRGVDEAYLNNTLYAPLPAELHRTHSQSPIAVELNVAEDLSRRRPTACKLLVKFFNLTEADKVEVSLNGISLRAPKVNFPVTFKGHGAPVYMALGHREWEFDVNPRDVRVGENTAEMRLVEKNPGLTKPVEVRAIALDTKFA